MALPRFLAQRPWKEVSNLLQRFAELVVVKYGEKVSLPAGGFLLQGKLKQSVKKKAMTIFDFHHQMGKPAETNVQEEI